MHFAATSVKYDSILTIDSVAGTETTAGFLAGLFNQLLRNKHVLDRLTAELRSTFKTDKDITFEKLVQIPYLTAVIEEGLRIFPSAPIGFMRTVPLGGDTVSGHWLPGGVCRVQDGNSMRPSSEMVADSEIDDSIYFHVGCNT